VGEFLKLEKKRRVDFQNFYSKNDKRKKGGGWGGKKKKGGEKWKTCLSRISKRTWRGKGRKWMN